MKKLRNSVRLIGRLGKDPEVRNLPGGKKVANFSLATSENYYNGNGEKVEETQWHNIVAWGKLAEIAHDYLAKGNEVALEGKLIHRKYETAEGQMRYITEISANEILKLSPKNLSSKAESEATVTE
ncbi:MAG: single-stranded DNA-binding protein [Cyclobacteriaceae bacterium]